MICYLDTSALVKLYIYEEGSPEVKELVTNSLLVATSKIAYAEARAALARGHREKALEDEIYAQAVEALKDDWRNYFTIEVSDTLIELAGELAEQHQLRGFDAVHLAAALILKQQVKENITVACWDKRLWQALNSNNFALLPEKLPGGGMN
ncbi:type II toxin-antitoxin system VapC family toxin [Moorella sp. E306M]|uniref:type II toxin-antitoxin system VapC family toxin n=1 Tax=Moorella sp. E306M TaxID=2572683 RepID=UPI0010FFC41A|nr:type II toxin-antitoxin system VapC family toxin [Moorella sp. E306M]GEA18485.1 twitching motility protein PilT [Moorella sp. E306M]